ncbi:hypothetical protein [Marisediminicola sp. LYQ134]|uniref:hypothetical protein n=1 Tax=Marisediminicola sp. LYQ134 TaxID=3391061 RepID=UPI003983926A
MITDERRRRDIGGFVALLVAQLFLTYVGFLALFEFISIGATNCRGYEGGHECLDTGYSIVIPFFAGFILALVAPVWGIVRIRQRLLAYWVPLAAIALLTVIFGISCGYAVYALSDPASRLSV